MFLQGCTKMQITSATSFNRIDLVNNQSSGKLKPFNLEMPTHKPPKMDKFEQSELGQFISNAVSSGSVSNEDVKLMMDTLKEAAESGSINIDRILEAIPESIKTYAADNAIDLSTIIEIPKMIGGHPPKIDGVHIPPNTELGQFAQQAISSGSVTEVDMITFDNALKDALMNGNIDAEAILGNTPESIKTYAADNNIDLSNLINTFKDNLQFV